MTPTGEWRAQCLRGPGGPRCGRPLPCGQTMARRREGAGYRRPGAGGERESSSLRLPLSLRGSSGFAGSMGKLSTAQARRTPPASTFRTRRRQPPKPPRGDPSGSRRFPCHRSLCSLRTSPRSFHRPPARRLSLRPAIPPAAVAAVVPGDRPKPPALTDFPGVLAKASVSPPPAAFAAATLATKPRSIGAGRLGDVTHRPRHDGEALVRYAELIAKGHRKELRAVLRLFL